jgi:DNA-binding transcriptional LysR family regulator
MRIVHCETAATSKTNIDSNDHLRLSFASMDIRQLRSFVVLAEELHFGHAAERLHIAQPALSQQLKVLERELGLVLLDRTNRRVSLTDAGTRLLDEARAVLERMDEAMAAMARVRTGDAGRLVLGVSAGVAAPTLRALLAAVAERGPDAYVEPRQVTTAEGLQGLARNELDAALIHTVPADRELASLVVSSDALGVALPSGHRLARRRAVSAAELSGEPLAWMRRRWEPTLYDEVIGTLAQAGFEPGPARETPNVETSLSMVAAGLAVSFKFAHEVARGRHVGVVWRPFADAQPVVPTALVWRRGDRSPLLATLRKAAEAVAP